jgi:hypothetical protein
MTVFEADLTAVLQTARTRRVCQGVPPTLTAYFVAAAVAAILAPCQVTAAGRMALESRGDQHGIATAVEAPDWSPVLQDAPHATCRKAHVDCMSSWGARAGKLSPQTCAAAPSPFPTTG